MQELKVGDAWEHAKVVNHARGKLKCSFLYNKNKVSLSEISNLVDIAKVKFCRNDIGYEPIEHFNIDGTAKYEILDYCGNPFNIKKGDLDLIKYIGNIYDELEEDICNHNFIKTSITKNKLWCSKCGEYKDL